MAKIKKNHTDKKEFLNEILLSKEQGVLTNKAIKMIMVIGKEYIKKHRYYDNPDDQADCLQEGLMNTILRWKNFDITKSNNAFAYFTEIFKNGTYQGFNTIIKKKGEEKEKKIKQFSYNNISDNGNVINI